MSINPLKNAAKGGPVRSGIRAHEWALMARIQRLKEHAEAWTQADLNGWDHEHFDPDLRSKEQDEYFARLKRDYHSISPTGGR